MMKRIAAVGWIVLIAGCGAQVTKEAAKAPEPVRTFRVVGIVRKVEPDEKSVTIRHEEIPGFMAAMTMPFHVEDREALDSVQVGDKVAATLKVQGSHSELTDLEVTEAAEPK